MKWNINEPLKMGCSVSQQGFVINTLTDCKETSITKQNKELIKDKTLQLFC